MGPVAIDVDFPKRRDACWWSWQRCIFFHPFTGVVGKHRVGKLFSQKNSFDEVGCLLLVLDSCSLAFLKVFRKVGQVRSPFASLTEELAPGVFALGKQ